jgi:hypothetical protein
MRSRRWQDWINLLLGAWLFASPWAMNFASSAHGAARNAYVVGAAIVLFAGVAMYMRAAWEEGVNILLGSWMMVSPWIIGFNTNNAVTENSVVCGLLVAGLAAWVTLRDADFDKWWYYRQTM